MAEIKNIPKIFKKDNNGYFNCIWCDRYKTKIITNLKNHYRKNKKCYNTKVYEINDILTDDISRIYNVNILKKYIEQLRNKINEKNIINNKIYTEIDMKIKNIPNTIFNKLVKNKSSRNTYVSRLNGLKNSDISNLLLTRDRNEIRDYILDNYKAPENMFNMLGVVIKSKYNSKTKTYIFYSKLHTKSMKEYEKRLNTLTEKEEKNWIDLKDIEKTFNDLYNKTDKTRKELRDAIIFGLYSSIEPRRNDYRIMKVIENPKTDYNKLDKSYNYYDKYNHTFIFNEYKTKNKYNKQIIELKNKHLYSLLDLYLKKNQEFLLDKQFLTSGGYTKFINRIFNKYFKKPNIGTTLLRKIYITSKYGKFKDYDNERSQTARNMGHSVKTSNKYYNKNI